MSAPLVSGHTRMSSNLASMMADEALQDELGERGVDYSFDRQKPEVVARERQAFYRILLGHQDGVGAGKVEVLGAKCVVIGKRVRGELQTEVEQRTEEALR